MNKEIKFRVWNGKSFEIEPRLNVSLLNSEPYICYIAGFGNEIHFFSGLKDKNNKDIYEGDIILSEYYSSLDDKYTEMTDVIIFENGCFKAKHISVYDKDNSIGSSLSDINKIEIIGNIFENPELLNKI